MEITTQQVELIRYEDTFSNEPHTHDDWFQVTIPTRGTFTFTQENHHYSMAAGLGMVQHPNDEHFFHLKEQSGVIIIKIHQELLQESFEQRTTEFALNQTFNPREVIDHFQHWTSSFLLHGMQDPIAVQETETQVIQFLKRTLQGSSTSLPPDNSRLQLKNPYMRRVIEYIHEHYTSPIHVESLAAIALQSRFHFIRSFKAAFGITPYQYILQLRVEEAKKQLVKTSATITHISAGLGFSCASQFYRIFAKIAGVTPERYRQVQQNR